MDKTTCIVVGAGPAGSSCAYSLAKKGIETVLLERGRVPGEKNVASFVLFTSVLKHLIPDFMKDVPVERNVVRSDQVLLSENDVKTIKSYNYRLLDDPICFTAFRRRYDAWLAQKAADAGAQLISGMKVTDLIIDAGRVVGIKVGDEELYADVVVGADGYHSIVGEKAGLIHEWAPERCYLGVKEVLDLAPDVINERFQLSDGIGCEQGIYCYNVSGIDVFSFTLYTNTDSVSLVAFARVNELKEKNIKLHEHLDTLKQHPYFNNLIKGAELREYAAHILSDGGRIKPKNLYGNGVLLCGEAGGIMETSSGMGVPICMLSGMMAAETIEDAIKKKNFSTRTMKNYLKYLDSTTLLDMVHKSRKTSNYYAGKAREERPLQMKGAADIYNRYWESGVDYISKQSYSILADLYFKIGQYSLPKLLRWPVAALIISFSLPASLIGKIKSKIRSRYYEWKKQIVS